MGQILRHAQCALEPPVCLLFRQRPGLPELVKGLVGQDTLAPQLRVRQHPHRQPAIFVSADIGVAGGIPGTGIVQRVWLFGMAAEQIPPVPTHHRRSAVGAVHMKPFHVRSPPDEYLDSGDWLCCKLQRLQGSSA